MKEVFMQEVISMVIEKFFICEESFRHRTSIMKTISYLAQDFELEVLPSIMGITEEEFTLILCGQHVSADRVQKLSDFARDYLEQIKETK